MSEVVLMEDHMKVVNQRDTLEEQNRDLRARMSREKNAWASDQAAQARVAGLERDLELVRKANTALLKKLDEAEKREARDCETFERVRGDAANLLGVVNEKNRRIEQLETLICAGDKRTWNNFLIQDAREWKERAQKLENENSSHQLEIMRLRALLERR